MFRKPNFFVAGAAKAGTTTLAKMLDQHHQVYISPIKEPNYFSTDISIAQFAKDYRRNTFLADDKYFTKRPLEKIHLSFIRNEDQYHSLFDEISEQKAIGECSTSYLFSEVAAQNIYQYNPDSRIIIILRNPVSRAFSHYLMALRFGYTTATFRQEIDNDFKKTTKGWGISRLYLELGMYSQQLLRYYQVFPSSQLKVFLTEDLNSKPEIVFKEICNFLDIDDSITLSSFRENTAQIPKNATLNKLLTETGIKKFLKQILSEKITKQSNKIFFSNQNLPVISDDDKQFLLSFYENDIQATSKLINRNLNHWLNH